MANMSSTSVTVFPSSNRTVRYQRSARHLSEKNITGITNKVTDKDSYVITSTFPSSPFEFVLGGYYFSVTGLSNFIDLQDFGSATAIYASIEIDATGAYATLYGQDDDSTGLYTGLDISPTQPVSPNWIKILGRERVGQAWAVPKESMVKFAAKSLPLVIDGGEI